VSSYGRGARILGLGIGVTGLVTFSYFSLASYVLDDDEYTRLSLLWSLMFVVAVVIYRPVEQLLAREIAAGRAAGVERTALRIQGGFALAFLAVALMLRETVRDDIFDGSETLYWILVAGILFYGASYFARGWLAGHHRLELYGLLVLMEASSRFLFALAVAVGIASGQDFVALGMAAAPLVSLVVVPFAFSRRRSAAARVERRQSAEDIGLARGGRFAVAVLAIMLAEQTLINAAVLTADATATDKAVAGFVFNALLIARAPLQLFQAIQGSLLPHLAGLEAASAEFRRAVRTTILWIAAFATTVAVGLLVLGPWAMDLLFEDEKRYGRWGLVLVAVGMGAHLVAGTLNQAALARDHAGAAAACWLLSAAAFVAWMLSSVIDDELLRAEAGYAGAASLLCALLYLVYRRPH
jgi:O-antigen/teichoic acid export membrane protein